MYRMMIIACAALCLAACAKKAGEGVVIGVFEPVTGPNAAGGEMELEGIMLARELRPLVTVGGTEYTVTLRVADNKSEKVDAANAVERLINKDKACVILGSWGSSLAMAGGEIAKDAKVPVVGLSCTNPLVTTGNDFYFRVCFIDPFQGKVMANYAFDSLGARNAVIVQEVSNDYSVGLAKFFTDTFRERTGNARAVLQTVNYNTGDMDFSAQLTAVKALGADVIFAPGNYTESALLISQARQQGITTPFIGTDTWETPEFIDVGKKEVEGAVFSTFFSFEYAASPLADTFLAAYREKYHKEPSSVAALGFDGYLVTLEAIERAGSLDPVKIRDALAQTKDFSGATGNTTLDSNGDAVKGAYLKTVENGRFVFKTFVNP